MSNGHFSPSQTAEVNPEANARPSVMSLAKILEAYAAQIVIWPGGKIAPAPLAPAARVTIEALALAADHAIEDIGKRSRGLAAVLQAAMGGEAATPGDLAAVGLLALELGRLSDSWRVVQSDAGARLTMADLVPVR